jgi:hypothetical protein
MLDTTIYTHMGHLPTTPLLYNSKISTAQECMAQYWFRYHLQKDTRQRPEYFAFGSDFHRMTLNNGIGSDYGQDGAELWLHQQVMPEPSKKQMLDMADAFFRTWQSQDRLLLEVEKTILHPLAGYTHFENWAVKADMVFEDHEGLWVGDLKTTSGYGAATAKYYHNSLQTKTFGYVNKLRYPELRGTKIFVVTKKAIRCEVETIILNDRDYEQAATHMHEAASKIDEAVSLNTFHRSCTSCINFMGRECPYIAICMEPKARMNPTYIEDLMTNWYADMNPDDHLELDLA